MAKDYTRDELAKWFEEKALSVKTGAARNKLLSADDRYADINNQFVGNMYFFRYDPKYKATLPMYDKYPLAIVIERYTDGFLGLNLHYLPVRYRVLFLQKLVKYGAIYNENDEIKRVRITYEILSNTKRFREFRPCLKRYLYSNIKSRILAVQPNEWDVATMLPVQQFKKAQAKTVWQESLQEMRN